MKWIFLLSSVLILITTSIHGGRKNKYLSNYEYYDYIEDNKTLWIHAFGSEEVFSVQGLILELKKQMPNIFPFFTTVTVEGKQISQYFIDECNVKVIPDDNLETMAYFFKIINPSAIIVIEHEVSPSLVLLARLHTVPIYLLNASLSSKTERLLHTADYLYKPLFNSFHTIFTEHAHSKKALANIGIMVPNIVQTGPIHTCNIIGKKESYIKLLTSSPEEFSIRFDYPIILAHSLDKKDLDIYIDLFNEMKKKYPTLKMILAAGRALGWRQNILNDITEMDYECYVWDYQGPAHLSNQQNKINGLLDDIEAIFLTKDIILSCIDSMLYFWHGFASLYIIDEDLAFTEGHNIAEAASWKNPVIVGPVNNIRNLSRERTFPYQDIVVTVNSKQELVNQTQLFLSNKKLCSTVGQEAFNWVKKQSEITTKALEPFFIDLRKHLECDSRINKS